MKLDYFDLLNPCGIAVQGVGRIRSPKIRDSICKIGNARYQYLLTLLLMNPRDYVFMLAKMTNPDLKENPYDELPEETKNELNMFDILTASGETRNDLADALCLFVDGTLNWDEKSDAYLVNAEIDDGKLLIDGKIDKGNFAYICDMCLQLAYIEVEKPEILKFKNERARQFYERFQKKKEAAKKAKKQNPDYELSNIISALATFHNSLNMTNIWDLTVYQIHDCFNRQQRKNQVFIHDQNYSVWGGEYKPELWIERMDRDKN